MLLLLLLLLRKTDSINESESKSESESEARETASIVDPMLRTEPSEPSLMNHHQSEGAPTKKMRVEAAPGTPDTSIFWRLPIWEGTLRYDELSDRDSERSDERETEPDTLSDTPSQDGQILDTEDAQPLSSHPWPIGDLLSATGHPVGHWLSAPSEIVVLQPCDLIDHQVERRSQPGIQSDLGETQTEPNQSTNQWDPYLIDHLVKRSQPGIQSDLGDTQIEPSQPGSQSDLVLQPCYLRSQPGIHSDLVLQPCYLRSQQGIQLDLGDTQIEPSKFQSDLGDTQIDPSQQCRVTSAGA